MAPKRNLVITPELIDRQIYFMRGQRVMLDSDLSKLYGVLTKAINQAVKRNRDRFPEDFAYQLTGQELAILKSQIVTSSFARGGKRKLPWAFTEQGVAMPSSVLRSPMAIRVNIEIMRAFVRLRRLLATPGELVSQLQKLAETVQFHDHQIKAIAEVLQKMMERPSAWQPKRSFGFASRAPQGRGVEGLRKSELQEANHEPLWIFQTSHHAPAFLRGRVQRRRLGGAGIAAKRRPCQSGAAGQARAVQAPFSGQGQAGHLSAHGRRAFADGLV